MGAARVPSPVDLSSTDAQMDFAAAIRQGGAEAVVV
jgi:hypothetical protein